MVKPKIRRPSPVYLSPSTPAQSPRLSSAFDPSDEPASRPASAFFSASPRSSRYTMANRPPTLTEILLDTSTPPWTLSAFMAYLSQNHCMETLEFTLDSQRYASFYDQLAAEDPPSHESISRVCSLWEKLMQVYIVPCAPREEAGRIIYELMNDSLLVPFLQSVAPHQLASPADEQARSPRRRSHNSGGRAIGHPTQFSASPHALDSEGLTDDSDSNSPPVVEPMTPPTTPPTPEYTFNTSPGGFQRAVAAHSKGWKKVGAKLGFSRKASSRRSMPTSSGAEYDVPMAESSQAHPL